MSQTLAKKLARSWKESGCPAERIVEICTLLIKTVTEMAERNGDGRALITHLKAADRVWREFANQFPGKLVADGFKNYLLHAVPAIQAIAHLIWPTKETAGSVNGKK